MIYRDATKYYEYFHITGQSLAGYRNTLDSYRGTFWPVIGVIWTVIGTLYGSF